MPAAYHGSTILPSIQKGSTPINSVYKGSTLLWTRGGVFIDFSQLPDAATLDPTQWDDNGPSTDWKLGITNGKTQIKIPDGLIGGFWDYRISYARYSHIVNAADDGFVEARLATRGADASLLTALFGYKSVLKFRVPNTGPQNNGIGVHFLAGHCWLMADQSGTEVQMADGGSFQPGDVVRVTSTGNLHILTLNGVEPNGDCRWDDSGSTVHKGTEFRSLQLGASGAKDFLGPREFSPAFDYVRMG